MSKINSIKKMAYKQIHKFEPVNYDYLDKVNYSKSSVNSSRPRINLVVPTIKKKKIFGGISTALNIFNSLGTKFDLEKRIIITDAAIDNELKEEYPKNLFVKTDEDALAYPQTSVYSVVESVRNEKTLPVRKNDIFIYTFWTTKYIFSELSNFQNSSFGSLHNQVYLIQDFEPDFYTWSSEYLLADTTYRDDHTMAIFNSRNLQNYFQQLGYTFKAQVSFDPVLNSSMVPFVSKNPRTRKENIVLFYGRPYTPRNCFALGIESLKSFVEKYSVDSSWKFYSLGVKHKDIELSENVMLESLGKLSLEDYASLLQRSKVGLSLMCSPHPSYPPLEMAAFGVQTVTNTFVSKNLSENFSNILSVQNCTFENISDQLYCAMKKSDETGASQPLNEAESKYINNPRQFDEVSKIFEQEILKKIEDDSSI